MGQTEATPLKLAVQKRRVDIVKLLLDRGADLNIRRNGTSALSLASIQGDLELVRLLVDKGAEVARRDIDWAKGPDREAIVALLRSTKEKQALASATPAASTAPVAAPAAQISDADEPSYKAGERPDDMALIVGVETYLDAPAAPYALRDAQAVRRHLLALGWPARNVIALSGEGAGRAALSKYLERWLPNNVTENSRIFFFFAGNGAVDAEGRAYLLPWDGDAQQLEATGYPLARLFETLNALKARSVFAVLDAGFSGTGPRSAAPKEARVPMAKPNLAAPEQKDVVALLAQGGTEPAAVVETQKHGALTYRFLKGLNGAALDATGAVTVRGVYRYARKAGPPAAQLLTGSLGEDADLRLR
jgi:hypothetical protein